MKSVTLRALEPEDIDDIYRWENDPSVWTSSATHLPFSRHVLTQYLLQATENDIYAQKQLRLVAEADGRSVGCADLFDYDPFHDRAGVGLLIDSRLRGCGYGTAMIRELGRFATHRIRLHQLYCHVAASNIASLTALRRCGFEPVGRLRDWLWNGSTWEDAFVLQWLLDKNEA
ncbi:MAG: GNAT family N-acetyltransferase [Bacteroidales bacterium]|nr:GNAT family N-acetyltransferase [Bacteroidales bacterium]